MNNMNNSNNNNFFNINNNNCNMNNMMENNQMQQQIMQQQMIAQQQMMAQQQQMMFQQMMQQQPIQQQTNIHVIFRKSGRADGQPMVPTMIECKLDEKVSSIIERYRNSSNDQDNDINFIFNAQPLNPSLTVGESGLSHNANIFVISNFSIKG